MPQSSKADPMSTARSSSRDPAQGILDVAEELAQTRGYNGFSYADIAQRLGVTKASLHYHFASKAELGRALIARYQVGFAKALDAIERQELDPAEKLRRYVALYDAVMSDDRMCLCGMLAAEYATLPRPMQEQLKLFFDANERWLTAVLEAGSRAGRFGFKEAPKERAQVLLGALEGAMLVARSYGDPQRFRSSAQHVLEDLGKFELLPQRKAKTDHTS
jgi:TetR/AcrR family transcriptional regulator, transcriptional repressor for nem operon